MRRRGVRIILLVLGALLVCLFSLCLLCAGASFVFEAPFTLAFGWPKYLWRVIPQVHPDPWAVVSAVVCLAAFTLGTHAFLRWLYRAWGHVENCETANSPRRVWPWKRSLQLVGLIVLMFVSGIAVTGMVHQTGWLVRSPEPLVQDAFEKAISRHNLKEIGLASLNYNDSFNTLPQSTFDATGRPMHSWQTALLPYLERGSLYDTIDQKKPWDDPANQKAMSSSVMVFIHPTLPGRLGVSHYAGNVQIVLSDTPKKLSDFPDGTSNTILAGEVSANFRAWGDPLNARDPRLGASGHPNGFGGPSGKLAQIVMLDGSVRTFNVELLEQLKNKVPE